ncbi:hypothetical protein HWV62_11868 [Athelia sp. TMB]|nr:hypothetical protein HWV62_11868 [Athelia sp. TMB]
MNPPAHPSQSEHPPRIAFNIRDIKCDQLPLRTLGRAGSFYVKILLDGDEKYRTARTKGRVPIVWSDICYLEASGSSSLELQVYRHHALHQDKFMGSWKVVVGDLVETYASGIVFVAAIQARRVLTAPPGPARITQKLRNADAQETPITVTASIATTPQGIGAESTNQMRRPNTPAESQRSSGSVESTPSTSITINSLMSPSAGDATILKSLANTNSNDTERLQREEALARARQGIDDAQLAPLAVDKAESAMNASTDAVLALQSFADTWNSLLSKIELFVQVTDQLTEVRSRLPRSLMINADCYVISIGFKIHPYAKTAWFILSLVPKAIIAQRDRDASLCNLMKTIEDIHSFVIEAEPLKIFASQSKILEDLGRLTVESAYLIRDFTIDKSFWKRIATLSFSGVEAKVQQYTEQFKKLEAAFQGRATVNIEITALRCLVKIEEIAKDISLQDMAYAKGAGYDLDRCCLPGTRLAILAELHQWINLPDADDTPRVLVLTGLAGSGKSAIANTIARFYDAMERLGSSIFFERADQAQRNCGNLLSTIARDVANLDSQWRSTLCDVIKSNDALRQTKSISRQMESFILQPGKSLNTIGPIVVVIDALDESGDVLARRDLLRSLAQNATQLPSNFRVLITTRAEDDIWRAFSNKQHVHLKTMDALDHVTIEADIAAFIQSQLAEISDILEKKMPEKQWCYSLVGASDHLFQWAATACLAILLRQGGHTPIEILVDLVTSRRNLDELYTSILSREFKEDDKVAMSRFRRVMGNILAAKEPLSMRSHSELWRQCDEDDLVESIVGPLGSLLSGTNAGDVPISALHTSFFDFLKDQERSGAYYIDPTQQNQHLALASLRVMNAKLKFNICGLESSHNRNSAVPDLAARIHSSVSTVLLYSCRFVGAHIDRTAQDEDMLRELNFFFLERFLYWLEVLSLEKYVNIASRSLGTIMTWTEKYSPELTGVVKDGISFVNVFAPAISESAPHVYVSAVPFAPTNSLISKQYSPKYPCLLRLVSGRLNNWPSALKTIEGHTETVVSVSYSPDGKHIVSGSWDRSICIWDAETGELVVGPLTGHGDPVTSVKYSLDGRYIASGSSDRTIRIWDALTGEVVAGPFKGHTGFIRSVAWSPDGKDVVSGSDDNTCRIWEIEAGGPVLGKLLEGHSDAVISVGYSPDGKYIASGSSDGSIRIWDAKTYEIVGAPFEGHTGGVSSVAFSPDSRHIVSGSWDKTIRVRSVSTGQLVSGPFEGHSKSITSVAYSKDGKFIATGSHDKTVRVLDSQSGVTVAGPFEGHSAAINSVSFSPDGRCIVSGAFDNTVRVWDAESIGIAARSVEEGRGGRVLAVACSPDGRHIASGSTDGSIRIWNLETGELVLGPLEGHGDRVRSIDYSPDGKLIVSGSYDKTIRIWSGETGTIVAGPFEGHEHFVMAVAWSPDGKYIVSSSNDETIRVWNATTGEIALGPLTGHRDSVMSVAYSANGQYLVSGSDDKTIRLWNTETGEMVGAPFEGHTSYVLSVAFSPDGQRVASGSADKTIRVWDIKTGQIVAGPFEGHSRQVNSVVYSPDGKYITSCSNDKTIRMWDVETGETIAGPFTAHSGEVNSVAYTRDGKYFVSSSEDGTIRVWRIEQALARANLSRSDNEPADFRDDCPMEKGWVSTASGDLLFWVPSWHREGLLWPSNTAVTESNLTRLDLSRFVHGFRWQECRESEMA